MKIVLTAGETPYRTEIDPGVMDVEITEAFNGLLLRTTNNEALTISIRDTGFEIHYWGPDTTHLLGVNEATRFIELKAGRVISHEQNGHWTEA